MIKELLKIIKLNFDSLSTITKIALFFIPFVIATLVVFKLNITFDPKIIQIYTRIILNFGVGLSIILLIALMKIEKKKVKFL
jgi:flagellar biosynthesis protein FliQ